jgi:hypothetical protein
LDENERLGAPFRVVAKTLSETPDTRKRTVSIRYDWTEKVGRRMSRMYVG